MLRYLAVFLTGLRVVCAVAIPFFVFDENWRWAALAVLIAALSDPMDGWCASKFPLPADHWARRHGKTMNDRASGLLSWTAPGSILVWLWLNHFGTSWFWSWVAACVVFLLGTLVFEYHKRDVYGLEHRVRAEVLQGWFFALLLFACGMQLAYLVEPKLDTLSWVGLLVSWAVAGLCSSHRWTDRPEVRVKYFANRIVNGM